MAVCGDRTTDLLQLFADGLEEWDEGVAAGLAALSALQRSLGELDAAQPSKEATDVLGCLLQLAPSIRLENYIQQQQKPPVTASDAASSIHEAVTKLREAVTEQQELLASLHSVSSQYQDVILSQQLTDLAVTAPATADLSAEELSHCSVPGSGDATAATAIPASAPGIPEEQQQDSSDVDTAATAAAAVQLQPEEVALLMDAVTTMLEQELQLMEAAVSSISLESSQEELSTLITLWELQPFTHEEAVASLLAAAAKEES